MDKWYFIIAVFVLIASCREHGTSTSEKPIEPTNPKIESKTDQVSNLQLESFPYSKLIDSLISLYHDPIKTVKLVPVNCDNLETQLLELYERDQSIRNSVDRDIEKADHENLLRMVSIFERCGFPVNGEIRDFRGYLGIFLILQHSEPKWIARYHDDFVKIIDQGRLPKDFLALLHDRFLLWNDLPQIYGTQIQDGRLYPLMDLQRVHQFRAEMGFEESLSGYLDRQGLDIEKEFNIQRQGS